MPSIPFTKGSSFCSSEICSKALSKLSTIGRRCSIMLFPPSSYICVFSFSERLRKFSYSASVRRYLSFKAASSALSPWSSSAASAWSSEDASESIVSCVSPAASASLSSFDTSSGCSTASSLCILFFSSSYASLCFFDTTLSFLYSKGTSSIS